MFWDSVYWNVGLHFWALRKSPFGVLWLSSHWNRESCHLYNGRVALGVAMSTHYWHVTYIQQKEQKAEYWALRNPIAKRPLLRLQVWDFTYCFLLYRLYLNHWSGTPCTYLLQYWGLLWVLLVQEENSLYRLTIIKPTRYIKYNRKSDEFIF